MRWPDGMNHTVFLLPHALSYPSQSASYLEINLKIPLGAIVVLFLQQQINRFAANLKGSDNMKKIFKNNVWVMALILAVSSLAVSLTGCGGSGGNGGGFSVGGVSLGTSARYAILAKTGVANIPVSSITGDVGLSANSRTAFTGWAYTADTTDTYLTSTQVTGKLFAADNVGGSTIPDLTTAVNNMETAYTDAAGRIASSAATTNVGAGTLTSLTLAPGVYEWGTAVTIPTDLTLNGSATDVWIFKIAQTLDMAAAKNIILSGGALSKNIYWQVAGAVTIGANTHFEGNILGKTSITLGNKTTINGRLMAQTAVNLDANTVTIP